MSVEEWADRLDQLYSEWGVPAEIEADTGGAITVTAIDQTAGIDVDAGAGEIRQQTLKPGATVRRAELAAKGTDPAELPRAATIALNGAVWRITSWRPRPGPYGEATGEAVLLLTAA